MELTICLSHENYCLDFDKDERSHSSLSTLAKIPDNSGQLLDNKDCSKTASRQVLDRNVEKVSICSCYSLLLFLFPKMNKRDDMLVHNFEHVIGTKCMSEKT